VSEATILDGLCTADDGATFCTPLEREVISTAVAFRLRELAAEQADKDYTLANYGGDPENKGREETRDELRRATDAALDLGLKAQAAVDALIAARAARTLKGEE
jgi:hypothetical protein